MGVSGTSHLTFARATSCSTATRSSRPWTGSERERFTADMPRNARVKPCFLPNRFVPRCQVFAGYPPSPPTRAPVFPPNELCPASRGTYPWLAWLMGSSPTRGHLPGRILGGIAVGFALTVVGFKVVVPDDPYAMLDETYLSTLKNDDDEANDAAKKVRIQGRGRVSHLCPAPSLPWTPRGQASHL